MRKLLLSLTLLASPSALAQGCFLLSTTPNSWDHQGEQLCIDRIFMLVDPTQPESPSNPRIEKTRIQLMAASPLTNHVVASFILDVLPSSPGSTMFGVSIPSNSIFRNIVVAFEDLDDNDENDERDLRGRVRIGGQVFYYRSLGFPESNSD